MSKPSFQNEVWRKTKSLPVNKSQHTNNRVDIFFHLQGWKSDLFFCSSRLLYLVSLEEGAWGVTGGCGRGTPVFFRPIFHDRILMVFYKRPAARAAATFPTSGPRGNIVFEINKNKTRVAEHASMQRAWVMRSGFHTKQRSRATLGRDVRAPVFVATRSDVTT